MVLASFCLVADVRHYAGDGGAILVANDRLLYFLIDRQD
ncbi:hypothetical protein N181_20125 [Sinorhizobium fredii USDA 205]|nr:hypothetical protein N181_20125 [Sinorhizobium fredii USDA 205]